MVAAGRLLLSTISASIPFGLGLLCQHVCMRVVVDLLDVAETLAAPFSFSATVQFVMERAVHSTTLPTCRAAMDDQRICVGPTCHSMPPRA